MRFATASILFLLLCTGMLTGPSRHACAEEAKKTLVSVNADKLDYDRVNDVYTAVGNVKIEQEGMLLQADRVVLNNKTGVAEAEGRVFLNQKGDAISAERLTVDTNTGAARITKGDLFLDKDNYHLKGEKIERKSESVYRIENGTFTTCDQGEWYLKADQIDVDLERYATAHGASFNMAGLPVLYTPYLLFPVRRQSGLLMPEMGHSSSEGFLLKNTLFWAISDYQDMTFTSDYRSKHGLGTGVEYRYVNSRDSSGGLSYNYFDTSHVVTVATTTVTPLENPPSTRWELKFQHDEEIAEDLTMRADIRLVSDEFYYRDLERKLELRSLPYLDSNAFYVERWDMASLYLLGQYSINLTQENDATPQKLPELRYNIFQEKIAGPLYLSLDGSAVNFTVASGGGVRRVDVMPQLTAAFGGGGFGFTPRAGVRTTYYSAGTGTAGVLGSHADEPVSRTYSFAGADLNARISKVYGQDKDAGIGRIRHSIEPTLSYSYIPPVDQTDPVTLLPLIRQFDAVDTVTKQNMVTATLVNRLTAHYKDAAGFTTYDLFVFRVAQSYELNSAGTSSSTRSRSDITSEFFWRTPKLLKVSANVKYDTYTGNYTSSNLSVDVTPEGMNFDLTHRFLKATPDNKRTEFLIGGAGFTAGPWRFQTQFWRDMENGKTTQRELGAHYASQCWGFGVSYTQRPGDTQYLMTLELKGLGEMKLL